MKRINNIGKKGFTLAEIIIAITIIGVLAAITIPALLVSTSEKTMEAQKKALHARMAQAFSQIEDLRTFERTKISDSATVDNSSAMNFLNEGLGKVYKITKICDKKYLNSNCSFPEEIILPNGNIFKIAENQTLVSYFDNSAYATKDTFEGLDTTVAAFKTANNESIAIYYNPRCHGSTTNGLFTGNAASAMCINMIYDLNGSENPPNQAGKDVGFITVFFPKDPDIILPVVYDNDTTESFTNYETATSVCKSQSNSLIPPNWQEGLSIALNKKLTNVENGSYLVTGAGSTRPYKVDTSKLMTSTTDDFTGLKLRCVYNN